MWHFKTEILEIGHSIKYRIQHNEKQNLINYAEFLQLLESNDEFILQFNDCLKSSKFEAFFWECLCSAKDRLSDTFEFVLVNSKSLATIQPDPDSFEAYFSNACPVVDFTNLGGDAHLIVPCPTNLKGFAHIATFVREAPEEQILLFWKTVSKVYQQEIENGPRWLSTAGMGVSWLHVRVDSRPKYYRHQPYRTIST